jgi:23S rRNA pseudouridine1911/1915/1917 synthase
MTPLDVMFWDNHLLVVDKPAGVPTVPDESDDASLYDLAREWVRTTFAKRGEVYLGVVHRLDRPVSGVIVFARTSKSAARLSAQMRAGGVRKIYWGVGRGQPATYAGVVEHWLLKDEERNRVHVVDGPRGGAKRAITRWKVLEQTGGETLYEFEPVTGRAHQIRACAAALGTPLLGDVKYGARQPLPDRSVALHAREIELEHPTRRERVRFLSPPPVSEAWAFAACRGG